MLSNDESERSALQTVSVSDIKDVKVRVDISDSSGRQKRHDFCQSMSEDTWRKTTSL